MSNDKQLGFLRDIKIIEEIIEMGAMDTNQIRTLYFPGKAGLRKAQARLAVLYDRKNLGRVPRALDQPYVYFIPRKRPLNLDHLIMLNWIYVWLVKLFGEVEEWNREYPDWQSFGLQPDALARVNELYYAIEMDRAESHNRFDKIQKYNDLYSKYGTEVMKLLGNPSRFPRVIIVTTTKNRKAKIEAMIKSNNPNNLKYQVRLLSEIKKECSQ